MERARGPEFDRRALLRNAALLGISVPALSALLQACADSPTGSGSGGGGGGQAIKIASPDNPVTWDIADDNQPIADGLQPEKGPLLLYNYADYIGPAVVKSFEEKYGVDVKVSTFNDTDEAITKIRTGAVPFDIYFPSYDQIGRLVTAKLVRPINHSYVGNLGNVWSTFQSPWYDGEAHYSVPYSVYTTGVGWRTDLVPDDVAALDNPYDSLWNPDYKGKVAVIDDWHTAMAMVALRAGITDVNTDDPDDLATIGEQPHRAEPGEQAQGHGLDVQRPALGTARDQPDVVGRRRQRAVLPAQGPVRRRAALLVPRGRDGTGRQRPDDGAQRWQEPRPRAPLPRPHARREELAEELRLHRLPAARRTPSTPTSWSPTATCPRTSPRPAYARSGSTSRTACSS